MDAGGRGGARIGLAAAALVAVAVLLAAVALDGDGAGAPGGARSGAPSVDAPSRRAPLAPPPPALGEAPGAAAEAAGGREAATAAAEDVVVTARDASTGARVLDFWVEAGGVRDLGGPSPPPLARADPATGEARLERSGAPRPLQVRARRYAVWSGTEPEPPGRRVVASLQRATTIHGFVRDADGAPVPGAHVELEFLGDAPEDLAADAEPVPFPGATLRIAAGDGSYEFTGVAPGVWRTRVPWLNGTSSVSAWQVVRAGEWRAVDHWLGARTRLVATVAGAGGGDGPPSRVIVARADDPDAHVASGYTDGRGEVTLGPLPTGSYVVSVQSSAGEASPREIEVATSSPPSVTIEFDLAPSPGG